jgi:hypothetical protein
MHPTCRIARAAAAAGFIGAALFSLQALAADDATIGGALMGLVGANPNNSGEKIDYRERAKVVVPPNRQALPAPRPADSHPAAWPVDQENSRRSGARVANSSASGDEPARENLTEPPAGYRRPTKDATKIRDPEAKSSGWSFDSIKQAIGLGGGQGQ